MEGMSSNFQGGNAAMLQMNNYGNISTQPVPQQNSTSELTPQKKAVFERLKKRMSLYRKRQNETIPRFDQTFTGICEQQNVETNLLQKKFLESKAKRVAKKADKKQTDVVGGNVMSKAQKRPAPDDLENDPDLHPPTKIPQQQQQQQNQQQQSQQSMDNMKFQVEIVQQLEFTTSSVNLQPQQISTNVTVKTTANGSMTTKYEPQEMKQQQQQQQKMNEPAKMQQMAPLPPPAPDLLQDFKQEPDNEFADLDFGGIANFMANDENELKKLFSNISEVFDTSDLFDDTKHIKQEPMMKPQHQIPQMSQMMNQNMNQNLNPMATNQFNQYVMQDPMQMQKPMMQQQPQMPQTQPTQQMRMYQQQTMQQQQQQQMQPDITPAAQTLKNMAQQHQVKSSMAMNYMRPVGQQMGIPQQQQMMPQQQQQQQQVPQQRLPYQQYNEYSQFTQQQQQQQQQAAQHKQMQLPFPPEMIKQEIMMQQQPPQMQHINTMKPMMNHQMIHEEPKIHQNYQNFQNQQFLQQQQQPQRTFQQQQPQPNPMSIHMKQTQMMHIQQQGNPGGSMQMQGAQHMGMTMNDGNFSMQQQQNMYFSQHHTHQPNTHPQYANNMAAAMQQQKRQQQQQQQHHPQMMGEGPTNTYNMMQNQSMSFTQ